MQKQYRLKRRNSFNYIYKRGKAVSDKFLTLYFTPTKYSIRVGFSVSKKVGGAVVRNKIRRRLKEIFRINMASVAHNYNYIVIARPSSADADYGVLEHSLLSLIEKAGLLSQSN